MNTEDTNKPAAPSEATTKLSDNDLDNVAGGAGDVTSAKVPASFWAGQNGEMTKMETKPGPKPPVTVGTNTATWSPTKKP